MRCLVIIFLLILCLRCSPKSDGFLQNRLEIPDCLKGTLIKEVQLENYVYYSQIIELYGGEISVAEVVKLNNLLAVNDQNSNLFINISHQSCDQIPNERIDEFSNFKIFSLIFYSTMEKYRHKLEEKFAYKNDRNISHYPTQTSLSRNFHEFSENDLAQLFDNYFTDFLNCYSENDFDSLYTKYNNGRRYSLLDESGMID